MKRKNLFSSISIRNIIIVVCIVITLIVVGIIGYIIFSNWISSAKETTEKLAKDMNEKIYNQIDAFIEIPEHINEINQNFINNNIINLEDTIQRDKFFVSVIEYHKSDIYSFSYGSKNGEYYGARINEKGIIEIMRNNGDTGGNSWYYSVNEDLTAGEIVVQAGKFDPRTRDWYKVAVKTGKPGFSPVYSHFVMDDLALSASWPIFDNEGKIKGVLGTHTVLSSLNTFLEETVSDIKGYAFIVEKDSQELVANSMNIDNFIHLQDGTMKRNNTYDIDNQAIMQAYEKHKETKENEFLFEYKGEDLYMNFIDYKKDGLNWVIITAVQADLLMANIISNIRLTVLLVIMSILLSIGIYFVVISKLISPMNNLLEVAEKISSGDLSKRAIVSRNDEIGRISKAFNKMADTSHKLINNLETVVKERTLKLEEVNETLRGSKEELRLILDSAAEAIYGIDMDGNCTFCNASCLRILGYNNENELLGENMHEQIHHTQKDGTIFLINDCKIAQSILDGVGKHVDDEVFWRAEGTSFDVEYYSYPQFKDEELIGAVVTFMDISERKRIEEKIKYISCHDSLTGLYNRGCFEDELKKIDAKKNLPISIIFGDLNGLKLTNDIFGHLAGDELIKKSSEVLKKICREEDIVARVGGDEFIVALPNTEKKDAQKIIARIKEELLKTKIEAIKCSMALGCDTKTNGRQSLERVMENAEDEMYKEKTMTRKNFNTDTLNSMIEALHKKFPEERNHSFSVSALCEEIGIALQLPETEVKKLKDAGFIHDIGKIILDKNILEKIDTLTEEDEIEIQQHAVVGYRILNIFDDTLDLAEGIYSHHEKWDGSGYPKGVKHEEIPLMSRIIAIAEAYDLMINSRKLSQEKALDMIKQQSGKQFDPKIVDAFIKMLTKQS